MFFKRLDGNRKTAQNDHWQNTIKTKSPKVATIAFKHDSVLQI
jgi:hypothetical protein